MEILFPELFPKNQNLTSLWINSLKFCTVCFSCMSSQGLPKYIENNCRPLAFTSFKAFWKNKNRPETSLPASFSAWFLKKNISFVMFYDCSIVMFKFHCLIFFINVYNMLYCNCLLAKLWRYKFEINLILSSFFTMS